MGRILFLSAVALVAYRYIARSNQRHQAIAAGKSGVEILPPAPATAGSQARQNASESHPKQELVPVASSRAAEPEPSR